MTYSGVLDYESTVTEEKIILHNIYQIYQLSLNVHFPP